MIWIKTPNILRSFWLYNFIVTKTEIRQTPKLVNSSSVLTANLADLQIVSLLDRKTIGNFSCFLNEIMSFQSEVIYNVYTPPIGMKYYDFVCPEITLHKLTLSYVKVLIQNKNLFPKVRFSWHYSGISKFRVSFRQLLSQKENMGNVAVSL